MPKRKKSRKRDYSAPHPALNLNTVASIPQTEVGPDGREYTVRRVSAGTKNYICPACGVTVHAGTAHVVAWPNDSLFGSEDDLSQRRHWHMACWSRRLRPIV